MNNPLLFPPTTHKGKGGVAISPTPPNYQYSSIFHPYILGLIW